MSRARVAAEEMRGVESVMRFMISCPLKRDSGESRKALRLKHLEYIASNRLMIVFGGPTLETDGTPEMMILVVEAGDYAQAESFIHAEPYCASGAVFESVCIRAWAQVMPELHADALASEITMERARRDQA